MTSRQRRPARIFRRLLLSTDRWRVHRDAPDGDPQMTLVGCVLGAANNRLQRRALGGWRFQVPSVVILRSAAFLVPLLCVLACGEGSDSPSRVADPEIAEYLSTVQELRPLRMGSVPRLPSATLDQGVRVSVARADGDAPEGIVRVSVEFVNGGRDTWESCVHSQL